MSVRSATDTKDFHSTDHLRESGKHILSYSQIASWMSCRHKWKLGYHFRLRSWQPKPQIALGDAIHRYIAAFLLGEDPAPTMFQWLDEILKTSGVMWTVDEELGFERMAEKAEQIGKETLGFLYDLGWETVLLNGVPLVEAEFSTAIPGWDEYRAHLDWVARDPKTGMIWLADFKTRGNFLPGLSEETNLQHTSYQKMLKLAGIDCNGTATIQIRSELPGEPKVNRDGASISRSAIRTTWAKYRAAVEAVGGDPDEYLDMKAKLDKVEFFNVMTAFRSDAEVTNVWDNIILPAARDIAAAAGRVPGVEVPTYRTFSHWVCNGCDLRNVCIGALRNYDPSGLLFTLKVDEERRAEIEAGLL